LSGRAGFSTQTWGKAKKPGNKKPAYWPVYLPLSAVAPIEDDYFLQVDSGGSNPVLMPPGE
jgi:hypothetical protein